MEFVEQQPSSSATSTNKKTSSASGGSVSVAALANDPLASYNIEALQSPALHISLRTFATLIAPFAPHLASEMWQVLLTHAFGHQHQHHPQNKSSTQFPAVFDQAWPQVDESMLVSSVAHVVISVSGNVKGVVDIPADLLTGNSTAALEAFALDLPLVQQLIQGKKVKKVISKVVNPGKAIFNVIV
jgi:leucyl-tRNA synthetase